MLGPLTYGALSQLVGAGNWWEAGGAAGAVRVYQPKGAASLAASYVDLAGNQDAAPGVAPTWNGTDGWIFNGSTQYLTTGFVPDDDQSQTVLIQFTNAPTTGGQFLFGSRNGAGNRQIGFRIVSGDWASFNGADRTRGTAQTSGNYGLNALNGYLNGADVGGGPHAAWGGTGLEVYIGARNNAGADNFTAVYIQAFVIYPTSLSDAHIAAVAAAMAAL